MKEFNYTITDAVGIHARPAGILAKKAASYKSTVTVVKGEKKADTRRLMALMGLGIKCGEVITVQVEGEDEDTAVKELEAFLTENKF
jgi:phosphocarrier protein HPr